MPKNIITVHMLALVFLSLAGCNSKPSSEHAAASVVQASSAAPSSDVPDSCKILSKAEVESVIGNVRDIQPAPVSDHIICKYKTSVQQGPYPQTFTIEILPNHYDGNAWAMAKKNNDQLLKTKPIPVAGVGDDAYLVSSDGPLSVLIGQRVVVVGEMALMLNPHAGPPNTVIDKEVALARKIVAKLR